jgi:peptide/nickel transport system substrate-binding protein
MTPITRRTFLAGAAATATTLAAGPSVHAQKRGGTLRVVPHADLKVLDPIWTTGYITRNHGYMIFDTLFAMDANLKVQPQMVDRWTASTNKMKWTFTLRDGLKFHDGQPVTAEDCVASIKRWGARDALGRLMMGAVGRMAPVDKKTFAIDLEQPFGLVLEALSKPSSNVPFIMPARLAATDPNEQVKEMVGSGPYKFAAAEWQPGNKVVYLANVDYVPRKETPSGAAGGKRVFVDRVEWRYIPDAATASAALEAGEVEYWENVPLDFTPKLEGNPAVTVFVTDTRGSQGWLRPNHLQPPFNNKKARQALLYMTDQKTYLDTAIGSAKYYRTCPAVFMCGGTPFESAVDAPKQDLEKARQLLKESGYDGRPIVVLDPTDSPYAHAPALVTAELLKKIGASVEVAAMDWSTMLARRANKGLVAQGGWNIFHTWSTSLDVITPAVHAAVSGAGEKAWFGWPTNDAVEKLRADFVRQTDPARQKQIAEQIQRIAYDDVPYVSWGQFVVPNAFRKNVRGVLQFGATLLWNISV